MLRRVSSRLSVANVICALLFGERYEHDDAAFLSILDAVTGARKVWEQDTELDIFPWLRFLPRYQKNLSELCHGHSELTRCGGIQVTGHFVFCQSNVSLKIVLLTRMSVIPKHVLTSRIWSTGCTFFWVGARAVVDLWFCPSTDLLKLNFLFRPNIHQFCAPSEQLGFQEKCFEV